MSHPSRLFRITEIIYVKKLRAFRKIQLFICQLNHRVPLFLPLLFPFFRSSTQVDAFDSTTKRRLKIRIPKNSDYVADGLQTLHFTVRAPLAQKLNSCVLRLSGRYPHYFSARMCVRNSTSLSTVASLQFVHLTLTECIRYPRRDACDNRAQCAVRKIWASSRKMIPCFRCFIFMAAPFPSLFFALSFSLSFSIASTRKQIYPAAILAFARV